METMNVLLNRRSIRSYTDKDIPNDIIMDILKGGMYAPSGGNEQPWDFIVIKDKSMLEKITEIHPYAKALLQCNAAILVCGNLEKERFPGLWIQDCSACTQNMLLAATAHGLGSLWLGIYPEEDRVEGLREMFSLPSHIVPFSIVSLGYAAEEKAVPQDRFKEENIHIEKW